MRYASAVWTLALLLLIAPGQASAFTLNLSPTSDDLISGRIYTDPFGLPIYSVLDDPVDDPDSDFVWADINPWVYVVDEGEVLLGLRDPAIDRSAYQVESVTAYWRGGSSLWCQENYVCPTADHRGFIRTNGASVYTAWQSVDVLTTFTANWTTNPTTGRSWTWDEIESLQLGIGMRSGYGDGWYSGYFSRAYIVVSYSAIPCPALPVPA